MRMSVLKNDPGFSLHAKYWKAFLNGEEVPYCITADEEAGEVLAHVTDEQGMVLLNNAKTETLKKVMTGKVELRLDKENFCF